MATFAPKVEIMLDLRNPQQELEQIISFVINQQKPESRIPFTEKIIESLQKGIEKAK